MIVVHCIVYTVQVSLISKIYGLCHFDSKTRHSTTVRAAWACAKQVHHKRKVAKTYYFWINTKAYDSEQGNHEQNTPFKPMRTKEEVASHEQICLVENTLNTQ